jgi:hypothetical protein
MVPEHSDNLRASDADRQRVADQLKAALDEGRLTLDEYDDRVRDAYAAKTYADLKGPLADLPAVAPESRSQLEPIPAEIAQQHLRGATRKWVAATWGSWISTSLIVTAIWFATWVASGVDHVPYFWPIWVIGPWGAILLATTISGVMQGQPRAEAEQRARKQARREVERRERRERRERDDN